MGLKPISVYLDSCLVIYLVEEHSTFAPLLENHIANATDWDRENLEIDWEKINK